MLLSSDTFRNLCRARELLGASPEQCLSVKHIAHQVAISPYHFIRQFEAVFGITPHQFRIQSRLDQAKLLLAKGDLSVTEVCMQIGFSSLGTFSDLCARRFGSPPSLYKRRARAMVQVPGNYPQELFPGCLSLMGCLPAAAFRNFQEASPLSLR
ncbi:MAG TPA: AraC family transcriptional regulator [Candidatus Sulfotelmatobacter sp.]|nr:AraC family transcriptional regulator [Candidatus Sulfotelmatobacter sp.]